MFYRTTRPVLCDGVDYATRDPFPKKDVVVDDKVFQQLKDLGAVEPADDVSAIVETLRADPAFSSLFPPAAPAEGTVGGEGDRVSDTAPLAGLEGGQPDGTGQQQPAGDEVSDTSGVTGLEMPPAPPTPETPQAAPPAAEEKPLAQMSRAELIEVAEREEVEHPADANKAAIVAAIIAKRKVTAA